MLRFKQESNQPIKGFSKKKILSNPKLLPNYNLPNDLLLSRTAWWMKKSKTKIMSYKFNLRQRKKWRRKRIKRELIEFCIQRKIKRLRWLRKPIWVRNSILRRQRRKKYFRNSPFPAQRIVVKRRYSKAIRIIKRRFLSSNRRYHRFSIKRNRRRFTWRNELVDSMHQKVINNNTPFISLWILEHNRFNKSSKLLSAQKKQKWKFFIKKYFKRFKTSFQNIIKTHQINFIYRRRFNKIRAKISKKKLVKILKEEYLNNVRNELNISEKEIFQKRKIFKSKHKKIIKPKLKKNNKVLLLRKFRLKSKRISRKFKLNIQLRKFKVMYNIVNENYRFCSDNESHDKYFLEKWRRSFRLDWTAKQIIPWLQPLWYTRSLYSFQTFNPFLRRITPYKTKRNKVYQLFRTILYNKYNRVKFKPRKRGGLRSYHITKILMRVILPFLGKITPKQFKKIWHSVQHLKSKQIGRYDQFLGKIETRIDVIAYRLNWAPTAAWARIFIRNGWIYVSKTHNYHNSSPQQIPKSRDLPVQQLFPFQFTKVAFKLNKSLNRAQKYNVSTPRVPININIGESIHINPSIKAYLSTFFAKSSKWKRKVIPPQFEVNRTNTSAILIKAPSIHVQRDHDRLNRLILRFIVN